MRNNALGLIEVKGYLGAIAAADAALKAAGVYCIGVEVIKGGLVTVKLGGEVGAVQAAVEAGAEAAVQLNVLLTRHVIPRVHEETAAMITNPVPSRARIEEQLAKDIAASIDANVKPVAATAKTKTDENKLNADTVVTLEQAEAQPASQGKKKDSGKESVAKRNKSTKKASS